MAIISLHSKIPAWSLTKRFLVFLRLRAGKTVIQLKGLLSPE
jgi:hypothetical protein